MNPAIETRNLTSEPRNGRQPTASSLLEFRNLAREPQEEWRRLLRFVGWSAADRDAASRSAEVLFRRGVDLVVQTDEYLRQFPETAAILGWDDGDDEAKRMEGRRFFVLWLGRTLGLDTSDEFALELFRAGKFHAGHGPHHIHVPPEYVTGSIGLTLAAFAHFMAEARLPADVIAGAMAAWSKYLTAQLDLMLLGYRVARELANGEIAVRCTVFGRLRPLIGVVETEVRAEPGGGVGDVLRKFFNCYPQVRAEALDRVWDSEEKSDTLWVEVIPAYIPRRGWRVLLNGRDLSYGGGLTVPVQTGDEVAIFPPGR